MMNNPFIHSLEFTDHLQIKYIGPHLDEGPLPALFYFSLSDKDSLGLDPFNQPAVYLSGLPIRVFSMTLPGHENNLPATQALERWADKIAEGRNIIKEFIDDVKLAVKFLFSENALIEGKVGVSGLSRGAFIAVHAAAEIPSFQTILGFAPLIRLEVAREFQTLSSNPLVHSLNLNQLTKKLTNRSVRFYIGNLDVRVGTRYCFDFIEKLSQSCLESGLRSPEVELMITPSIGRDGHGTSKPIFQQGAQWIAEKLGAIHVM